MGKHTWGVTFDDGSLSLATGDDIEEAVYDVEATLRSNGDELTIENVIEIKRGGHH